MSPFWRRRRPAEPVEETAVVGPAAEEEVIEEEVAPPPRPPRIWPWLLALLLLVLAGALAYWWFTRDEEKTTMPPVVGLTETQARARLADAELETDVVRQASERQTGIVFAQRPGGGTQLDEGERVEISVSSGLVRVSVPNVRGLAEEKAKETLTDNDFRSKVERVFAGAPKGQVVEQDPRAGERAAKGTAVLLKVSKGRNLNKVPDVVGRKEADAVRILRAQEFTPRIFDVPSTEPRGTVVSQSPAAGEQAPPDSRVRINVSTGEATGQTTERTETTGTTGAAGTTRVTVPNVVGLAQTPALRRVRAAGLVGAVVYRTSTQPRGRVIAERPGAGTTARRGSRVTLTVSAGAATAEQVDVPDVRGSTLDDATQTLEDAGFRVETIRVGAGDTVVDQQPPADTTAPRGSVVTLFVGE